MTKTIIKQQQNAETLVALYIYIYIDTFTDKWNSLTRPHTSVLKNKTVLVFAQKIEKYFVDFKTYLLGKMRSFCAHFTSGYI